MRWIKYLTLLLFVSTHVLCQNETQKWYFGANSGLNFATNPPSVIPSPVFNSIEGGASLCDANGNLLFYTDGVTVWNQAQAIMANGNGLAGNQSSTQSAVIIKKPASTSEYFLFTQGGGWSGLKYSVVDMSLAVGMGSVTTKNITLLDPATEKLAAVRHCNGQDFWVVSHEITAAVFYSYLVTASGVNTTAVLSTASTTFGFGTQTGCIKFSPNGKKLAVVRSSGGLLELYDFNSMTGVISNPFVLSSSVLGGYGCEFSPDGTKIYLSVAGPNDLIQWDLCAGSPSAIISSSVILSAGTPEMPGSLQLASDGKIYVAEYSFNSHVLSVIHHPNIPGPACSFSYAAVNLGTGFSTLGLPNFVSGYLKKPVAFLYTALCPVINFTVPPSSCSGSETYTRTTWSFGDAASGVENTSSLSAVSHTFSSPGTYTVKLMLYSDCGIDSTVTLMHVLTPTLSVTGNFSLCAGNSATLQAGGADTYSWSFGTTLTSSLVISPTVSTTYTLLGAFENGCSSTVTFVNVTILPSPALIVSDAKNICAGETALLQASGANSYLWNTGATSSTISVSPSATTLYSVSGQGIDGCTSSSTIEVVLKPNPTISVTSVSLCSGNTQTLAATSPIPGTTFLWQPGASTNSLFVISPPTPVNYTVTAFLNGCKSSAVSHVTVIPTEIPVTNFYYKTPVCLSGNNPSPLLSSNFNTGGIFSSEILNVDKESGLIELSNSAAGTYVINYTVEAKNCTSAGSNTATLVLAEPLVLTVSPDLKIGPGTSATLNVSGGASYSWTASPDLSCSDCASPIVSPAQSTRYCVSTDKEGCRAQACINVIVGCEGGDLSLPNAFSPNGDGFNDAFCLQGWDLCIDYFSVLIFNRWGEKVFESDNSSFCWDGTFNGKVLESEVFVYTLVASFSNGTRVDRKGNITLLR